MEPMDIQFLSGRLPYPYTELANILYKKVRFFMDDLVQGRPVIPLLPGNGSVNGHGTNGAERKRRRKER